MLKAVLAGLAGFSFLCSVLSAPPVQHAFGIPDSSPHVLDPVSTPYEAYMDEFRFPAIGTSAHLHHALRHLHPDGVFTVTSAREFQFIQYCQNPLNNATLKKLDDSAISGLKKLSFVPPARRLESNGFLSETVQWGSYQIEWKGQDFKLLFASWSEANGMQQQQSHVVSSTKEVAEQFILAVSAFFHSIGDAILVFNQGYWEPDPLMWQNVQKSSWKDIILDSKLKEDVRHEYQSFFKSEAVYRNFGVPWKRGVIFLGPPGNGKTITLKAIMKESGVPTLYVKTLHTYAGDEFGIKQVFKRAREEAPCLLVFEDIDSLINDANRSFFLNEVDGLEGNDGLLIIGTTNHFDRLDPALSSRPSRFDRKYNFPDPILSERISYCQYWQDKLASNKDVDFPDSLVQEIAEKTEDFSFAYLKEVFVATLIRIAGDESEDPVTFRKSLMRQIKALREELSKPHDEANHPFQAAPGCGVSKRLAPIGSFPVSKAKM